MDDDASDVSNALDRHGRVNDLLVPTQSDPGAHAGQAKRPSRDDRKMHELLFDNRDELIARCKSKVALRPQRDAADEQLKNGVSTRQQRRADP
jgi:hypothetical protein